MNGSQNNNRVLPDFDIVASDEAGHAVLAYILGREIEHIRFVPNARRTYNGETIYRQPCSPPHIDPYVPYGKIKLRLPQHPDKEIPLPHPDGVTGIRVIQCAGQAAQILLCRQKGVDVMLATVGMGNCRLILRSLKEEGIPKQLRKERFREAQSFALQILSSPVCSAVVNNLTTFLLVKIHQAQSRNRNPFIKGKDIQNNISNAFRDFTRQPS